LSEYVRLDIEKAWINRVAYHLYLTSERLVAIAYVRWEATVRRDMGDFLWDHTKGKKTKDLTLDEKLQLSEKNFAIPNCSIMKVIYKKKGFISSEHLTVEETSGKKTQFMLNLAWRHDKVLVNAFSEIYGARFVAV